MNPNFVRKRHVGSELWNWLLLCFWQCCLWWWYVNKNGRCEPYLLHKSNFRLLSWHWWMDPLCTRTFLVQPQCYPLFNKHLKTVCCGVSYLDSCIDCLSRFKWFFSLGMVHSVLQIPKEWQARSRPTGHGRRLWEWFCQAFFPLECPGNLVCVTDTLKYWLKRLFLYMCACAFDASGR